MLVMDGNFLHLRRNTLTIPTIQNLKTSLLEATEQIGTLKMEYTISIPKGLNENNTARSETRGYSSSNFDMVKRGNSHIIKFRPQLRIWQKIIVFEYFSRLHSKLIEFLVNGHFGTLSRNIALPDSRNWPHEPEATMPHQKFISVWDGDQNRGLTLITKGIPEYEPLLNEEEKFTLALTLYRSVGNWGHHLSVVPRMMIPDAQLFNRELTFEYRIGSTINSMG